MDRASDGEQEHLRRCLVRQVVTWYRERGRDWAEHYVKGWLRWPEIRDDFWAQVRAGNTGAWGEWR